MGRQAARPTGREVRVGRVARYRQAPCPDLQSWILFHLLNIGDQGVRWVRILIRKTIPPKTLLHCAVADFCLADHLSARYLCVPRPLTVRFKHLTADCAYLAHAHVYTWNSLDSQPIC